MKKWADFLFELFVRMFFGAIFGGIFATLMAWKIYLKDISHDDFTHAKMVAIIGVALGALYSAVTIRREVLPWARSILSDR